MSNHVFVVVPENISDSDEVWEREIKQNELEWKNGRSERVQNRQQQFQTNYAGEDWKTAYDYDVAMRLFKKYVNCFPEDYSAYTVMQMIEKIYRDKMPLWIWGFIRNRVAGKRALIWWKYKQQQIDEYEIRMKYNRALQLISDDLRFQWFKQCKMHKIDLISLASMTRRLYAGFGMTPRMDDKLDKMYKRYEKQIIKLMLT